MFQLVVIFLLFAGSVSSFSNYQPFNAINHLPLMENSLDSIEMSNRKALQSNKIVECDIEDIFNSFGLRELQELIEATAARKSVSPFAILRMLYKRMKNKEEMEETMMSAIEAASLQDLLKPPTIDLPIPVKMPPDSSRAPYSLPSNGPTNNDVEDETKVVIIPVAPAAPNRLPNRVLPVGKPDFKPIIDAPILMGNMGPPVGEINHVLPGVFPLLSSIKSNQLRPPMGATVRVNSRDPGNPINRDITVTVSPLMTLIEALRQAEIKYQNVLGLSHDSDVFSFAHSPEFDCYTVDRIDEVVKNEDSGWKVTIADRDGQVVYDSFCLPNAKDILVKPGTLISLSYVQL